MADDSMKTNIRPENLSSDDGVEGQRDFFLAQVVEFIETTENDEHPKKVKIEDN